MRFIIRKGHPLYVQLMDVQKQMQAAHEEAVKIVEEVGLGENWTDISQPNTLSGGISGFEVAKGTKPPENWKKERDRLYFPKKNVKENKALLAKINALPTVPCSAINSLVGYDWRNHCKPRHLSFRPGIKFSDEYVLIEFSDSVDPKLYTPVDGMEEMLYSEWQKLYDEK